MYGQIAVDRELTADSPTVERGEELGTGADVAPLAQGIDLVIVGVVHPVSLEVGDSLVIVVAVLPIGTTDYPEVVEVGGLDDDGVRSVFLELSRAVVEYHLRGVHQHGLHPAELRRQLFAADGQFHGHLVPLLNFLGECLLVAEVYLVDEHQHRHLHLLHLL